MLGSVMIYKSQTDYTYKEAVQVDAQLRRSMSFLNNSAVPNGIYCVNEKSLDLLRDDPSFDLGMDFNRQSTPFLHSLTPQVGDFQPSSSVIRELTPDESNSEDLLVNMDFSFAEDGNIVDSSPPRGAGLDENINEQEINLSLGNALNEEITLESPITAKSNNAQVVESATTGRSNLQSRLNNNVEPSLESRHRHKMIKMKYDGKIMISMNELKKYREQYLGSSLVIQEKRRRIDEHAFSSIFSTFTDRIKFHKQQSNPPKLRRSSTASSIEQARRRRSSSVSSVENARRFRLEQQSDPIGDEFALEMPAEDENDTVLQLDFEADDAFMDIDIDKSMSKEDISTKKVQLLKIIESKMQEKSDNEDSLAFVDVCPVESTKRSDAAVLFHRLLHLEQDGSVSVDFLDVSGSMNKWNPLEPESISISLR